MIRMGRSSKPEEPTTNSFQPQTPVADAGYRYSTETQAASTRAVSESDSMARDIKEGRLSGFVGHGTTLTGETEFHAMLRVDGRLIGTVTSESGTLIIGTNGQVDANIVVAAALINGNVNGDIFATEKLQLGRTARVIGNIQSPRLIVEEGAILEGSCSMISARESNEKQVAVEEPQYEIAETSTYNESEESLDEGETATLFTDDDEEETAETAAA